MIKKLLTLLALITLSTASFATDKPLVMESGQLKQLPANTTIQLNASGTGAAPINIPHGTAPTSPVNGDCWTTTTGLYCQINGTTAGPYAAAGSITAKDEGSTLSSNVTSIDFTGTGVTATNTGGAITVNVPTTGTGGTITAQDEGSTLTSSLSSINWVGGGVTATNSGSSVTVTVPLPGLTLISSQTPTGTGTVTFSSIPGTYKDLLIEVQGRSTQSATSTTINIQFNGDTTTANYERSRFSAANSTSSSSAATDNACCFIPGATATASTGGNIHLEIANYAGTTFHKVYVGTYDGRFGTALSSMTNGFTSGRWNNTAAITSIALVLASGNWDTGSVVSLYGRQ